ncbi:AraC family transcriptional regulator [Paenibacillus thalictri]|uniref:AraC family transcriptional regulator n=1 Tax=Paenibacillus thalictri TaxID=2527873 RepID=A0A4Q9DTG0_9BACL|nr:AraC family transcriptional regulator [Paenibacillus thalictri]TBL79425.1 AraC family transcriptional regulator [Paenibacillus thalictri]
MERQLNSSQYMKEKFPFYIKRFFHNHHDVPKLHGHDFVELVYVVRGEAQHVFEGAVNDIRAGDVFIINPGEVHTYKIKPGKKLEIINCLFMPDLIQESWLTDLGVSHSMDFYYVHPFLNKKERFHSRLNLRGADADRALYMLEHMIAELENRNTGYETLLRLQMMELLILLSRFYRTCDFQNVKETSRVHAKQLLIQRICGYLERYFDKKLSIPAICDLFGISARQLNRVFKEATGMTVFDMVHKIRIERAKHLLAETDEKVIVIAGKVGYDDPAFFSRLFHRQVGCPPGKYRETV